MQELILKLTKLNTSTIQSVKDFYNGDDPSHDWLHILRLLNQGITFSKALKANNSLLIPAILMHDMINIPKDHHLRSKASELSSKKAKEILKSTAYNEEEIGQISQIILEHSYSANLKATSIESEILQDIDKLDAIGAIGIMRWATVGARMNAKYYEPIDPWAKERELNDQKFSLDHFENKLLHLNKRLNTDIAKEVGRSRQSLMLQFINQLKTEL